MAMCFPCPGEQPPGGRRPLLRAADPAAPGGSHRAAGRAAGAAAAAAGRHVGAAETSGAALWRLGADGATIWP